MYCALPGWVGPNSGNKRSATKGEIVIDFLLAFSLCAAVAVVTWTAVEIDRHLL